MRSVVQRVGRATVRVDGETIAEIGRGIVVLVGVERGDTPADAHMTARKLSGLRIFPGDDGKPMDRNLLDIHGAALVISQFTLCGTVKKGRRPSFDRAEDPARAEPLYFAVADALRDRGLEVKTGRFGANMAVELVNEGPVTFIVVSEGGVLR